MPKTSMRGLSGREPLDDVSNAGNASRSCKKEPAKGGDGGPRDRLLLVRADLSKLINQVDELVMHALENKSANEEREEIECFIRILSNMHSSLQSWVPRLKQAFVSSAIGTGRGPCLTDKTCSAIDGERLTSDGPNEPDQGPIVPLSPLVSWRNGACTVESGRQLFVLTPLQKSKSVAAKSSDSGKSLLGGSKNKHNSWSTLGLSTSYSPSGTHNALVEKIDVLPAPNKLLMSRTRASDASGTGFVSPNKTSNCMDKFIYCLTPCLKTALPKTCLLLDSIPESSLPDNRFIHNGTPWIARTQKNNACPVSKNSNSSNCSDNSSSDEVSKTLASKYPDLFGLQPATVQRKEVEENLHWLLSPPKTCVLMEPPDEKFILASGGNIYSLSSDLHSLNLAVPETTPMCKVFENVTENFENAGEATLKRELWTKFEAVSAHGLRFDPSIFPKLSRKRLLDMLDEVS